MKITYDPEADALYIQLGRGQAVDSIDIVEGVSADLDDAGQVIGLEVLDARERLGPELETVSYENLVLGKKAALSLPKG